MTPQDEPKTTETPMCSELRCKGMYISKDGPEPADIIQGDTTHWWCSQTHYSIGPDKDWVHQSVCTPTRSCYRKPGSPA
jgi:hypothetical protein